MLITILSSKVLARDDKWFITELPGKWKLDYERRKEQYKTGYFSSINIPYKTFASYKNVGVSELLEDALSLNLVKQTHFQVYLLEVKNAIIMFQIVSLCRVVLVQTGGTGDIYLNTTMAVIW